MVNAKKQTQCYSTNVKVQVQSSHVNCDGDDAQMRHKCKTYIQITMLRHGWSTNAKLKNEGEVKQQLLISDIVNKLLNKIPTIRWLVALRIEIFIFWIF
jgi:hypothetical protein